VDARGTAAAPLGALRLRGRIRPTGTLSPTDAPSSARWRRSAAVSTGAPLPLAVAVRAAARTSARLPLLSVRRTPFFMGLDRPALGGRRDAIPSVELVIIPYGAWATGRAHSVGNLQADRCLQTHGSCAWMQRDDRMTNDCNFCAHASRLRIVLRVLQLGLDAPLVTLLGHDTQRSPVQLRGVDNRTLLPVLDSTGFATDHAE